jgi:hypothetical protein
MPLNVDLFHELVLSVHNLNQGGIRAQSFDLSGHNPLLVKVDNRLQADCV